MTVRASVCMAAYNGSRYIEDQIRSILDDLGMNDELIVVDDRSKDDTADLVEAMDDPRIRFHRSPENRGYVRTFSKAAEMARGEYIFLADQDDIWVAGRTELLIRELRDHAVVAGNVAIFGGPPVPADWSLRGRDSSRGIRNIVGTLVGYRPYYGCAMGFRRDFADVVLPMPKHLYESHDLWIALVANMAREMQHVEEPPVLYRRLHDDNQTPRGWRSPRHIVRARIMLFRCLLTAAARLRKHRRAGGSRQAQD
jgi:glycosyltransferase involved in cell wall biosynthesis